MSLEHFFQNLIDRVERSDEIHNQGTDDQGFYKPTKTVLLRHLKLLKDLHQKPLAKPMLKASWISALEILPPDWVQPNPEEQQALRKMLE